MQGGKGGWGISKQWIWGVEMMWNRWNIGLQDLVACYAMLCYAIKNNKRESGEVNWTCLLKERVWEGKVLSWGHWNCCTCLIVSLMEEVLLQWNFCCIRKTLPVSCGSGTRIFGCCFFFLFFSFSYYLFEKHC